VQKKDHGYQAITGTIYYQKVRNALCDLGASVNLMSKGMFERLGYLALTPTSRIVQLADASIRYLEGIVESLLAFVQGSCIFGDFVIPDMKDDAKLPLILGRPFLSDAQARINVEMGPSVSALERRTRCSDFDQKKSNGIRCKEMMIELGDGWSHNPSSHNL
jgi:hypothetical protein